MQLEISYLLIAEEKFAHFFFFFLLRHTYDQIKYISNDILLLFFESHTKNRPSNLIKVVKLNNIAWHHQLVLNLLLLKQQKEQECRIFQAQALQLKWMVLRRFLPVQNYFHRPYSRAMRPRKRPTISSQAF